MVCQLPTVRYSPRYRIHWIYEFICACNLIMRDSWIDEVHMSASWLCSLFLSHLLSLGSSDRSHNAFPSKLGGLVLYEEDCVFMNTFTGHNTFIILFPTRPRAFFLALICSGCDGLGWVDPRVYLSGAESSL